MQESSSPPVRNGGCQCGAVRYQVIGPTLRLVVCHCNECRKQSASAFGVSVFVARDALRLTQGEPKFWSRPTDSGRVLEGAFCSNCGSRLWHQRADGSGDISIKAGSLDEAVDLGAAVHIWTMRKLPGVLIPETATRYERGPEEG